MPAAAAELPLSQVLPLLRPPLLRLRSSRVLHLRIARPDAWEWTSKNWSGCKNAADGWWDSKNLVDGGGVSISAPSSGASASAGTCAWGRHSQSTAATTSAPARASSQRPAAAASRSTPQGVPPISKPQVPTASTPQAPPQAPPASKPQVPPGWMWVYAYLCADVYVPVWHSACALGRVHGLTLGNAGVHTFRVRAVHGTHPTGCLLYTSDAADE